MAQLVEPPDIQSNPVGETAPNEIGRASCRERV